MIVLEDLLEILVRKLTEFKVLVDANILVSASIYYYASKDFGKDKINYIFSL